MVDYVTVNKAARLLGVPVDTIRKWADRGLLAHLRAVGKGERLFLRSDIKEFARRRGLAAEAAGAEQTHQPMGVGLMREQQYNNKAQHAWGGAGPAGGNGGASDSILAHALAYAHRGWPVIPIRPGSKEPLTAHGVKDATTDETVIRGWWTRWPDANVAIATGSISGLVVVDRDPRNGGDESLHDLEARHGPLTDTVTALTGGGGAHSYYALPSGLAIRSRQLAPGLELKADGGYVVAPPSLHASGRRYEWEIAHAPWEHPLAELPDWVVNLAQERAGGGGGRRTYELLFAGDPIPQGQRHLSLCSFVGLMARRGVDEATAYALARAARDYLAAEGDHPVPDEELREMVDYVYRKQKDAGRLFLSMVSAWDGDGREAGIELIPASKVGPPQPTPWLWEGVVPLAPGAVVMLAAQGGVGKTLLARGLATSIASGKRFLGRGTLKVPVVYCDLESPDDVHADLVERMGRPDALYFVRALSLRTEQERQALARKAKEVGAKLIVIDTLQDAWLCEDEWDNVEAQRQMWALRDMAREAGAIVLFTWHLGKDPTRGARGASARQDRCHVVLELAIGRGGHRTLWRRKSKWGDRGFLLAYAYQDGNFTLLKDSGRPGCIPFAVDGGGSAPVRLERGDASLSRRSSVEDFVAACCERDPRARERSQKLYAWYRDWCLRGGLEPVTHAAFGNALSHLGIGKAKGSDGCILRVGLRVRTDGTDILRTVVQTVRK